MNIDTTHLLDDKEKIIYNNLLKVLNLKQITIEESIIMDYIRSHTLTNMYITTDILNKIIKECVDIQLEKNKIKSNTITQIPDLGENNTKVLSSIIKNDNSDTPIRELREELIYIKGISGVEGKFTNTFLLNKRFNNVESLELISGYVNDYGFVKQYIPPFSNIDASGIDHPASVDLGIYPDVNNIIMGSIGAIPFIWIDIEDPEIRTYSYYSDYSVHSISGCCDCSGTDVYKQICDTTEDQYKKCIPHGSFLVELRHYNFPVSGLGQANPGSNLVYIVDKPGNYIKKFNNLISMDKLKINIRNIVGNPLWGSKNCLAKSTDLWNSVHGDITGQGVGCENVNLLRWEFIFKVKYYINVMDNKFLIQNS